MIIDYTLNKEQAAALFLEHACMMGSSDVIYDYRVAELFGQDVSEWAENNMGFDLYINSNDFSMWGSGSHYFTRSGYNKIVSHHNYLVSRKEYEASEGGRIWTALRKARSDRMDAYEAEEDRKRAERKAKREAARRAKQAAQEKKDQEGTQNEVL